MQPSKPLSPGETYFDEDLGIEAVAVGSNVCTVESMKCVYHGHCKHVRGCVTPHPNPDIVYLPKLQYAMFKLTQLVI